MDILTQLNRAMAYIEAHIDDDIALADVSSVTAYSPYHFGRLFYYIADMPLSEYIRKRKLSQAALKLQNGSYKVIDLAVLYGYDSFPYIICALKKPDSDTTGFHTANIPKFTWAVFRSGVSEHMGTEILNMYNRAHSEWLPSSGYDKAAGPDMEVYYDAQGGGYFQEVWIPAIKKEND